ncbi:hypothetical protein [Actinokineospora bangkokensis]|uniref:Uncharacterized protein n=1 Tax=Actinokineospora bangkokensis TaxID=1193682 RepID=A0A1Q9LEG1_9PSEU|nr:hypothetical protein [Actinokineospora bangkokensis]OLR90393.1 hypothetical protein BJP25_27465 [Actinokineospora bangkokensis]
MPQVPYITTWSGEESKRQRVVDRKAGPGIAFVDERPQDRDSRGLLWTRQKRAYGRGRPLFGQVHSPRQRHAMDKLLCQVCAHPADRDPDGGVLWMLRDHRNDWPDWPNGMAVTEPPICRNCVKVSAQRCPAMRKGHALIRAWAMPIAGVRGNLYRPTENGPVLIGPQVVWFGADLRWVLGMHLVREFTEADVLN